MKLPAHRKLKGRNLIGRNLQRIRYSQDPAITLDDLVARLEIRGLFLSKSTLSKIENRQRVVLDFEVVEIAEALRVPIMQLYGQK
ncbi:MAG: XRE family transcriptional regulator [Opitutaceae bacterium]|nr:XRE family transcriptional regulator [Opitutaceae bacterium]